MSKQNSLLIASVSVLASGMAHGAVNYSGSIDYQITGTDRFTLDLNQDLTPDYVIRFEENSGVVTTKPMVDSRTAQNPTLNPGAWVLSQADTGSPVIGGGTMIDASFAATYPTNKLGYLYQQWEDNTVVGDWSPTEVTEGFVGLELTSGEDVNYGWVRLIYDPTAPAGSLTVVDYAYETTPGVGISTAAAVPEPSVFSLLGVGGLALLLRKRK